jgi:hypothetical protein
MIDFKCAREPRSLSRLASLDLGFFTNPSEMQLVTKSTGSMMKKNKPNNPPTRRTGLDRRWIPSANHQPERRRSRDRRTIRNRSFLEPFESKGVEENSELFPEINIQARQPEAKILALPFDEKGSSEPRETVFKRITSDDE